MKSVWVIEEQSRSFDWLVIAETPEEALKAFKKAWNDWCAATGADPYYWGSIGAKWEGISAREVKLGVCYMDREPFGLG